MSSQSTTQDPSQAPEQKKLERPHFCCVGGGKGGVGKSIISVNLARALAANGLRVVLADLDLGGANLHTLLGVRTPPASLREFFCGEIDSLDDLLLYIDDLGFHLLPGGDEVAGVVQPGFQRKQKLVRHLNKLKAEVVICDLGGNSGLDTLDLFNQADVALVVSTPEPTSIQNAYGFVKAALLRRILRAAERGSASRDLLEQIWSPKQSQDHLTVDELICLADERSADTGRLIRDTIRQARIEMVVNMASREEANRTHQSLAGVTQKFLGLKITYLGHVVSENRIHELVMRGQPPLIGRELFNPRLWQELLTRIEPAMAVGINEEVRIGDEVLHIQTEDLGRPAAAYHALVYSGGRILLSRRVSYDSAFMARMASASKKERVQHLHRTVIEAIRSGRISLDDREQPQPDVSGGGERTG
jgi:flagellar biosynthesis protein FlhG